MNVDEMIACLKGIDPNKIATICNFLLSDPANDIRFVPILSELTMDYRVAMWIPIPCSYGEVRFLAAKALAHTYKLMGIKDIVHLDNTFYPMTIWQLGKFVEKAGIDWPINSKDSDLEILVKLREMKALDMIDKDFDPARVLAQSWRS